MKHGSGSPKARRIVTQASQWNMATLGNLYGRVSRRVEDAAPLIAFNMCSTVPLTHAHTTRDPRRTELGARELDEEISGDSMHMPHIIGKIQAVNHVDA
jgi:hypothetical protein